MTTDGKKKSLGGYIVILEGILLILVALPIFGIPVQSSLVLSVVIFIAISAAMDKKWYVAAIFIAFSLWVFYARQQKMQSPLPRTVLSWEERTTMSLSDLIYIAPKRCEVPKSDRIIELEQLAKSGDAKSQLAVGLDYWRGETVCMNPEEGFLWLKKAAIQGEPEAQRIVSVAYSKGMGVSQNEYEARYWGNKRFSTKREDVTLESQAATALKREFESESERVLALGLRCVDNDDKNLCQIFYGDFDRFIARYGGRDVDICDLELTQYVGYKVPCVHKDRYMYVFTDGSIGSRQ